jgi:nitrogen-specific signal transduction histidine kinase
LASAYAQLNSVLECTSDSVIKINSQWVVVYGNHRAIESLPDFKLGKSYWACFPGAIGTPLEETLRTAMEKRTAATYEDFYAPYEQWYRGHVYPSEDGLSIFFANVTEEKALQEKVEREQFLKEKRIEALSHMAGGLAHEINNPLAIIHGRASDLLHLASGAAIARGGAQGMRQHREDIGSCHEDSARSEGVWTGSQQRPDGDGVDL